jgi:esterase/lipase
MTRKLLDDDGENRAVRTFLQLYGATSSITLKDMCRHLEMSGFDGYWPEWVADSHDRDHLTKGGAQSWLRYLFSLEQTTDVPSDGESNG